MGTLDRAIQIALSAPPRSVLDDAGQPHILGPISALNMFGREDDRVAAILSDVVSGCADWPLQRLQDECFPMHIVEAVEALTARDAETEEATAFRASSNEIARRVWLKQLYTPDLFETAGDGRQPMQPRHRLLAILAGFDMGRRADQNISAS